MNSNLPMITEKNNIFKTFISFVKRIFRKKENVEYCENAEQIVSDNAIKDKYKVENVKDITKDVIRQGKIKEIIQIVENNPDTLNSLNVRELELIDQYYIDEIKKYKNKIANIS